MRSVKSSAASRVVMRISVRKTYAWVTMKSIQKSRSSVMEAASLAAVGSSIVMGVYAAPIWRAHTLDMSE
eukprot:2624514-Rhodomonas_salina.1